MRRSTLHRVEKRSAGERYSSPFFAAPAWDARVEVLPGCGGGDGGGANAEKRFPCTTAGAWLMKRRAAEYGADKALRIE